MQVEHPRSHMRHAFPSQLLAKLCIDENNFGVTVLQFTFNIVPTTQLSVFDCSFLGHTMHIVVKYLIMLIM